MDNMRHAVERVPKDVPVTTIISRKPIRHALMRRLKTSDYDLLVIGSRGRGALAASPLAVGLLAVWPLLDAVRPPRWWQSRRTRWTVIAAVLIVSEIWQLGRFGIISL